MKPIIPVEQFADLLFPALGVDLTLGFGMQRDGTTRSGTNVRTYEPSTDRSRGGSRPGLAQYIPERVDGTSTLVQHINYIVDPRAEATVDYDPPGGITGSPNPYGGGYDPYTGLGVPAGGTYADPTGPPRVTVPRTVRFGGTGSWFMRKRKVQAGIAFVQEAFGASMFSMTDPVVTGHLLIVASAVYAVGATTVTVADSLGNAYSQVGGYVSVEDSLAPGQFMTISMWYAVSAAGGPLDVTVTQSAGNVAAAVEEYSGTSGSPLDGSSTNTATGLGPGVVVVDTGVVGVSEPGELLFGIFSRPTNSGSGSTFSPSAGYTERAGGFELLGVGTGQAATAILNALMATECVAIGASFKPA